MKIQEKSEEQIDVYCFFSISEVSGLFLSARAQKIGEKRGTGRQKIRRYSQERGISKSRDCYAEPALMLQSCNSRAPPHCRRPFWELETARSRQYQRVICSTIRDPYQRIF